ncbi:MAG TPA: beta/gamma crystallin-related protein [Usitatibacter sp.]|nr:beta/gamma crystallin-related protein [Usitatibacter sp.]
MKAFLLTLTLAAVAVPALGEVTLYGREDFRGRALTIPDQARNLERGGFAGRASSAVVRGSPYELCDDIGFAGRCVVLAPGRYPTLAAMGMDNAVASVRPVAAPPQAAAEITLFGREDFAGRSFVTREPVRNMERNEFGTRASSAIVRGGRFEICDDRGFQGRCMVLRPGQYPSLAAMGMDNAVQSVRPITRQARIEERRFAPPPPVVEERRFAAPPPVAYDYRPRREERLFEAEVVAVRAVYGRAEQRCWVEREAVGGGDANVGGAIAGAIIGGILGHQVGSGRGNDAATAAGAVAGAAIGSNYGGTTYSRDVQRCSRDRVSGPPQFWDVTYRFRGVDRYVQMTRPPGPTITVNADGEPRAAS